jgi:hypothetical protein
MLMPGDIQKLLTILKNELMLFHMLAFAYNHLDPELLIQGLFTGHYFVLVLDHALAC